MLKKAALVKQIYVTVNHEIGVLNRIADFLADRGINIEAVAGYEMTGTDKARIMLVVDDTRRATDLLKQKGFSALEEREEILLVLENKPGALKSVTSILAAKDINIKQLYGTMSTEKSPVRLVMATSDNQAALVTLKKAVAKQQRLFRSKKAVPLHDGRPFCYLPDQAGPHSGRPPVPSVSLVLLVVAASQDHAVDLLDIRGLCLHLLGLGIFPLVVDGTLPLIVRHADHLFHEKLPVGVLCPHHVPADQGCIGAVGQDLAIHVQGEDVEILVDEGALRVIEGGEGLRLPVGLVIRNGLVQQGFCLGGAAPVLGPGNARHQHEYDDARK